MSLAYIAIAVSCRMFFSQHQTVRDPNVYLIKHQQQMLQCENACCPFDGGFDGFYMLFTGFGHIFLYVFDFLMVFTCFTVLVFVALFRGFQCFNCKGKAPTICSEGLSVAITKAPLNLKKLPKKTFKGFGKKSKVCLRKKHSKFSSKQHSKSVNNKAKKNIT